jgi:outer membrane lipoprotein-sorting protein
MRTRGATLLACLIGLAALPAAAQPVPLPTPAPLPKSGTVPPPPSAVQAKPGAPSPLAPAAQPQTVPTLRPSGSVPRPGETVAFDASQRALVERINIYLMSIQNLVGDFVQVGPDGTRSTGKFYLQKPGRVRFEYNPPSVIELVADGSSVEVRDRRLDTRDRYQLSQTPLRFLLSDRIDLARDTNLIGVSADDLFASVVIEEKQTLGGTHRLMLMFGAKDLQLRQWTITDPQGYDTTVAISNLDSSKRLDPAMFRIEYDRREIMQ